MGFECSNVDTSPRGGLVIKAWTYELLNKKDVSYDLSGQKQVWLLDLQVDETGERIHNAGGIGQQRFCNLKVDMAQYSLQYFQLWGKGEIRQREQTPGDHLTKGTCGRETFLYSMWLHI